MKKLNLLFVFVVSFIIAGCQQPITPKAKTSAKPELSVKSVSKPIEPVQEPVMPVLALEKPTAPINEVVQQPIEPITQAAQESTVPVNTLPTEPTAPINEVVQQPIKPLIKTVQKPAVSAAKTAGKLAGTKTFIGKVDLVSLGDEASGISTNILVKDEKGQLMIFSVKPDTIIAAKDGKTLDLSEIKKDNKVDIGYIVVGREPSEAFIVHKAESIRLIE